MAIINLEQFYQEISDKKGRLMAIDVGSKTLGLALSDRSFSLASPFKTINRSTWEKDIPEIKSIIQEHKVVAIIVGLPLHMDGSEGERCQMVRKWTEKLLTFIDLPTCFWDERLSTVTATDIMLEVGLSRKRRKELVDKIAASYILRTFLEHHPRAV